MKNLLAQEDIHYSIADKMLQLSAQFHSRRRLWCRRKLTLSILDTAVYFLCSRYIEALSYKRNICPIVSEEVNFK